MNALRKFCTEKHAYFVLIRPIRDLDHNTMMLKIRTVEPIKPLHLQYKQQDKRQYCRLREGL